MFARPKPEAYLLPTERRVLRCRRHWVILMPNLVLTVAVVVVLVGLSALIPEGGAGSVVAVTVLWYLQLATVVRLAVVMADWWDDILMITDERLMNVTGLLASTMTDTPLSKITDRKIRHTWIGNRLGYGTIITESAGPESLQRLRFVPAPMTFYKAIAELTSKKGLPPPAEGGEQRATHPSIEDEVTEWPVRDED